MTFEERVPLTGCERQIRFTSNSKPGANQHDVGEAGREQPNRQRQVDAFASAHFPKSALHRRDTFSRTSESYGHQKIRDSRAAFDLKSLNPILPHVSQGLQIGGSGAVEHRSHGKSIRRF
jgi:hypothetical protein